MTYSLLVLSYEERLIGIGVVSGSTAVGDRVPWGDGSAGVVATQAYTNVKLGKRVLELLRRGFQVKEALEKALEEDPGRKYRQLAALNIEGVGSAYTGSLCPYYRNQIVKKNIVAIGNLLSSTYVIDIMVDTYLNGGGSLPDRMIHAMYKASKAGGDMRGDRSAALLIFKLDPKEREENMIVDLRIKYSIDPVKDLSEKLKHLRKI